jgi:O-antigen ligase
MSAHGPLLAGTELSAGGSARRGPARAVPDPGPRFLHAAGRGLGRLIGTLLSFEALFALFLYSNNIKPFLPRLPFDETVALMAASAPLAVWILWRKGLRREGVVVVAAGLLFFGWLATTMLWSPGRTLALRAVAFNLTFNLYCLIVGALVLAGDRSRIRRFLFFLVVIGLILAGNGLWIYVEHGTFRYYRPFMFTRYYLTWTYPVVSASAVALVLALTAPAGSARQLLGLALALVFGAFLLVGGARGPLLGLAVCLVVPLVVVAPRAERGALLVPKIQILAFLLVTGAGAYVAYLLATGQMTATLSRFLSLLSYLQYQGTALRHERLSYWSNALTFWSQAPLLGNGIGSFSSLYVPGGGEVAGTHPHNILLEILAETGLVGLALFTLLLLAAAQGARPARLREDPLYLCAWMLFASLLLIRAMLSDDLAYQWELFLAIGLLSLSPPAGDDAAGRRPSGAGIGQRGLGRPEAPIEPPGSGLLSRAARERARAAGRSC